MCIRLEFGLIYPRNKCFTGDFSLFPSSDWLFKRSGREFSSFLDVSILRQSLRVNESRILSVDSEFNTTARATTTHLQKQGENQNTRNTSWTLKSLLYCSRMAFLTEIRRTLIRISACQIAVRDAVRYPVK